MPAIPFNNSYIHLPEHCYQRQSAASVPNPQLIRLNLQLAEQLGIDGQWLQSAEGIAALAGNSVPEGADPIATVYAGHQFGSWNPQLGDGRALLLGEVIGKDGIRYDIQLKGSGRTPYSRGGDGKSPLGPVLREYIVSEAMAALGVPTTRSLAAVTTGEQVYREEVLPGAILTRVAQSHIRIGTLQFFAARRDTDTLRAVVDHVIDRHYPQASDADNPVQALLAAVIEKQATLIAQWQLLGFIHGVMNTDNMLLCGETIDYGPCAFMEAFDPATVFSSIDQGGRYAYGNQPGIGHWNLAQLAQAILPLLDEDQDKAVELAQAAIDTYPDKFLSAYRDGMARKLGLMELDEQDDSLVQDFLQLLQEEKSDFTLSFRRLTELADSVDASESVHELFEFSSAFHPWLDRWRQRLEREPTSAAQRQQRMMAANPLFIPRNHRVEEAIAAATENDDFTPFRQLVDLLARPYDYQPGLLDYAQPAQPGQAVTQTFCGT